MSLCSYVDYLLRIFQIATLILRKVVIVLHGLVKQSKI